MKGIEQCHRKTSMAILQGSPIRTVDLFIFPAEGGNQGMIFPVQQHQNIIVLHAQLFQTMMLWALMRFCHAGKIDDFRVLRECLFQDLEMRNVLCETTQITPWSIFFSL